MNTRSHHGRNVSSTRIWEVTAAEPFQMVYFPLFTPRQMVKLTHGGRRVCGETSEADAVSVLATHRIGGPAEFAEGLGYVGAMELQGHAGSQRQLGHHVLRGERGGDTITHVANHVTPPALMSTFDIFLPS